MRRFFKYFAAAVGVQVGLTILSMWIYYLGAFLYIYWPWAWLADQLLGPGGHATAGTYILGGLIGLIAYALLSGVVICVFKNRPRTP
jgi:hypothetical protein